MASQANIQKRRMKLKEMLLDGIGISNCSELLNCHPDTLARDFRAVRDDISVELDAEGRLTPGRLVSRARTVKLHTLLTLKYSLARIARLLGLSVCYCYAVKKYECSGDAKIRIKITRPIVAVDGETAIPVGEYDAIRVGKGNIALCGDSRTYIANGEVVAESHKLISVYRT